MISSFQAEIIAVLETNSGSMLHRECSPYDEMVDVIREETGFEPRFHDIADCLDKEGLEAISRFTIDEIAAENARHLLDYPAHQGLVEPFVRRIEALAEAVALLGALPDVEDDLVDALEDLRAELERQLDTMVEKLAKVLCDSCGQPIE